LTDAVSYHSGSRLHTASANSGSASLGCIQSEVNGMVGMRGMLLALLVGSAQAAVTDVTLDNGLRVIVQERKIIAHR